MSDVTAQATPTPAIGLVQTVSLFTRGSQSVRIVRVTRANEPTRLLVNGPGTEYCVHRLDDPMDGVRYESDLECRLVRQGYQLASFGSDERRSGRDRRSAQRTAERRTLLQRVV